MILKPINPCASCIGADWPDQGFIPASGTGDNGVLVLGEAGGEHEAKEGLPLVGGSGYYLWNGLKRIGIERDGFRVHNVLSCRPPANKLAGMAYETAVINSCSPLLNDTIEGMRSHCGRIAKTFVILTLGKIAFKRVMGLQDGHAILREDYLNYPFWSDRYGAWVIAADHPSYLMRGNHHLAPVLHHAFKRALDIAANGLTLEKPDYVLDPPAVQFTSWVDDYLRVCGRPDCYLSYDIETAYKQGKAEDQVDVKEESDEGAILRCSFCYQSGRAVSVPWRPEYFPSLERIFASDGKKFGWNNENFDNPRIRRHCPIRGTILDGMVAWHVLNSALPKALGFVTPFYVKNVSMWKHLSNVQPAYYNAADADMAWRNMMGILVGLKENEQGPVFDRHIVQASQVFTYMSEQGVPLDLTMRQEAETTLSTDLAVIEHDIQEAVPSEVKQEQVYRRLPSGAFDGVTVRPTSNVETACDACGLVRPPKNHFAKTKKKANPCHGAGTLTIPGVEYYKPLEWKISQKGLLAYQKAKRHRPITVLDRDTKEIKVSFDEDAINHLRKMYPQDVLYPRILDKRELQKLLSTYVGVTQPDGRIKGGMPTGSDGLVRTLFTRNPNTLRSASQDPNLQNLPRPKGADDYATIIRNLIKATDGCTFTARDYSGIEAVLVGYFASAPRYIRLAKIDVHSYYTAYALHQIDGRISGNDLPLLSWDDDKLRRRLAEIKKEFKTERNDLYKHLVHGNNFMQGAVGTQRKVYHETGKEVPLPIIKKVMGVYFELFPEIPTWHNTILLQAEKDGFLRNPFGYILRFAKVFEYQKTGGRWDRKPGPQANEVVAFLPQSTAAGIIIEAMLRLFFERFQEAGQYLRLLVHDELFSMCPKDVVDIVDSVMQEEMEKPIKELPLPVSYGMGPYLTILTEGKRGERWGLMK